MLEDALLDRLPIAALEILVESSLLRERALRLAMQHQLGQALVVEALVVE